jgi:hypothetical protein
MDESLNISKEKEEKFKALEKLLNQMKGESLLDMDLKKPKKEKRPRLSEIGDRGKFYSS